jgi:hypothetical protein
MSIIQLIASSNYITVNKALIRLLGIDEAIILGELASEYEYWYRREELQDGYFYSTIENIEENTTLTEYKQRKALNNLKEQGIVSIKIKGIPAKRFIKINEKQVLNLLDNNNFKILSASSLKNEELETEIPKGNKNNINKNKNKNNDNKKERKTSYDAILSGIEDAELKALYLDYIKMRKLIKAPMTDRALQMLINKVNDLEPNNIENQKQLLENAIMNNWKSVYPLKKEATNVSGSNKPSGEEYAFLG